MSRVSGRRRSGANLEAVRDVGNHFGREKHEQQAHRAMDWLGAAAGRDAIERKMILQIAGMIALGVWNLSSSMPP